MNNSFEIIDGILYIDKTLFQESQHVENGISLLTGSFTTEIFSRKPALSTGPKSITVNYHNIDSIHIERNPENFIEKLRSEYPNQVRGHLLIAQRDTPIRDITISDY